MSGRAYNWDFSVFYCQDFILTVQVQGKLPAERLLE